MKRPFDSRRFLLLYSGVLTVAFGLTVLAGAARVGRESFDEIDVQRINVVEPDGTIRLVLSSKAKFPGILFHGEEYPHPNRRTAGILFYNDEGTENGGLVFGGAADSTGNVSAYGHLSFDQYDQDQVFTIDASEDAGNRKAGLAVWDRPDWSMEELIRLMGRVGDLPEAERRAEISKFFAGRESAHPRLYLGKSDDGSVSLRLNDNEGRERLIVQVAPDGAPVMRFLDETGQEVARFPDTAGRGKVNP